MSFANNLASLPVLRTEYPNAVTVIKRRLVIDNRWPELGSNALHTTAPETRTRSSGTFSKRLAGVEELTACLISLMCTRTTGTKLSPEWLEKVKNAFALHY